MYSFILVEMIRSSEVRSCLSLQVCAALVLEAVWLQQQVLLKEIRRIGEAERPRCAAEAPTSASV